MSNGANTEAIPLYVKQPKVYPREVKGRFARLRVIAAWVLLGLYYVLPWISINGQQLVLFDLVNRQFHIFGITLWPQDLIILSLLLAMAALTLFFFTALAGRLWCGYACPQTVWTEVFLWMERVTEGRRNKRIKLDQGPWNREKIARKSAKQFLWITFALWTGFTFVGFFVPIRELGMRLIEFNLGGWETFWLFFYSFATYGNAGYLREQVCKYMCPYARFQSAMFDDNSLVISYDEARGEPRGPRKKSDDRHELGLGDCIDCMGCVQVCPTGIDIRDGLQIECIACAACIDVCDDVMDRMGYPRGLIRYTTENALNDKPTRILRPRIFIYIAALLALATLIGLVLTGRDPLLVDVLRDRTALHRVTDQTLENPFTLKLSNRTDRELAVRIAAEGLPGLRVIEPTAPVSISPSQVANQPLTIGLPIERAKAGMHDIMIITTDAAGEVLNETETRFFIPARALE
ncbi:MULTISPECIES: cytochrome c oxidase accessory protein CcoG [unclassified Wenzhouxiangella]|uniref:cytochrome c oxidase accessory protein CcoG n=1 Tax=unclassified Wenzhouxiangella TaxID=2613841 RepID=UPI000E326D34|nr:MULTISPECIES: cytochrome c oxidase accessory protein CcoG [unclassified Wenzhouxiangella]RFF27138.1 cytochrome c oxidase accessory protein CcoG [Wenzhouxiangella sp. 15181]RFP69176.1 cytochrome c oxidase accessory protein CcoG [Wenzhouxiangella sp. 15190]